MLEEIDGLIAAIVPPLQGMAYLLGEQVNLVVPGSNGTTMAMSTAALTAFVMPWVDDLSAILAALARFLDFL